MTTRQELIERLKHNRTPWKWLSDEEKEVLDEIINNVVALNHRNDSPYPNVVYRIHKDYTEEEERPAVPDKFVVTGKGYYRELQPTDEKLNHLIDCIQWLYAKVERMEK